jgi:hypothetical protein
MISIISISDSPCLFHPLNPSASVPLYLSTLTALNLLYHLLSIATTLSSLLEHHCSTFFTPFTTLHFFLYPLHVEADEKHFKPQQCFGT